HSALHDEVPRHGHGSLDLPLDHRGARRQAVGHAEGDPRRGIPVRLACRVPHRLSAPISFSICSDCSIASAHSPGSLVTMAAAGSTMAAPRALANRLTRFWKGWIRSCSSSFPLAMLTYVWAFCCRWLAACESS